MGLKERLGIDLGVFKESTTWKALGIGIVLFSIIGYAGLSMFDIASSGYGVDRDEIRLAPDFEVETVNRTVEESELVNESGWFKLSDHRGKVVIIDFMAIDCANCHLVQEHLENEIEDWRDYDGEYEIVIISVGSWYPSPLMEGESLEMLNETFGDTDSDSHMPWIVATGDMDSVLKSEVIHSGMNNSSLSLDDGVYCLEAWVDDSEREISCIDIGVTDNSHDNDDLSNDVDGIEIIFEANSSLNFTIDTSLEGNVSWELIEMTRGDMVEEYQAQAIPVALIIDHEGFIIAKASSGTPTGGWGDFDSAVLAAADGEAEDMRFSLAKVDRSAAYAIRYVAKNIVAAGLADQCEVQVAYAIGVAQPVSLLVNTAGTSKIPEEEIERLVREHFDLRPKAIIQMLDLLRPIYKNTAAYGHFGRNEADGFPWERTDKAAALRDAAGL